ncbi:MAG: filamentous hemagglutinin N-terminal domain-containing protein, partial [Terrimicrobiaceae bacterium]|nr:filamentous hemagglutinin N-terminal domain-containing protein [Terrimicrobiaceae bacterium]
MRAAAVATAVAALAMPGRAGDILRGGAPIGVPKRTANAGLDAGATAAAAAQATAKDRLSRTTQAIDSVKALQTAARNATSAGRRKPLPGLDPNHPGRRLPFVLDGLGPKGLQIADGVPKNLKKPKPGENPALWIGADLPRQTAAGKGGKNVTIVQNESQAILNWKTFNIGKKTTLTFDQSAGGADASKWIAFNKVSDPSGRPSQILGSIRAEGQVYVINRNGIIFGGASQVNVHTLVASALPINDNLIARGLLDNPDAQFLFSALALPAGGQGTPQFVPPPALTPDLETGDVVVEAGATITSPTSAEKVGGRIMLVGANVKNEGTLSTPDGQTILAAGLQVGVAAHATGDPAVRGLDVYVGAVLDPATADTAYAGVATNSGLIDAPHANVTITGKDIRQLGVIDSSTSVSLNGSIDLIANYDAVTNVGFDATKPTTGNPFLYKSTGLITLGNGSVTRILPEIASTQSVIGKELALRSQIDLEGHVIHLDDSAMVLAPNANVGVNAGVWNFFSPAKPSTISPAKSEFVYTGGQIYADSGAFIDVAGTTGVETPLSQNILTLQLRGAELSNSPLQRTGVLRGPDITIDLRESGTFNGLSWVGTPLANAQGFVDLIQRTVAELTTAGGSVNLHAGGSVVLQRGSIIDVSGGWLHYGSGFVETTRVISGGRLIDIADATPDLVYDGIYTAKFTQTQSKWGITKTFANPLALSGRRFERDYIAGRDGGSIAITAPTMAIDGRLTGNTTAGTRQLRDASKHTDLPAASKLSLAFQAQDPAPYTVAQYPSFSPTPPKIVFDPNASQAAADSFALDALGNPIPLREDRAKLVILSSDLVNYDGFGSLSIDDSDGRIVLPANVALETQPGGSIDLKASNLDVRGRITAPGGTLNFTVYDFSPTRAAILLSDTTSPDYHTPLPNPRHGNFTLAATGSLSTAGLIVDDRLNLDHPNTGPIMQDGGQISITSYSAHLRAGSVIDVSGGVVMNAKGVPSYGDAGSIAIIAGQDPRLASILGGELVLGSTLKGFAGGTGGSLTIQAPRIRIGQSASNSREFAISPDFFNRGGFSSFSFIGIGSRPFRVDPFSTGQPVASDVAFRSIPDNRFDPGLSIEPGTTISPVVQSWLALPLTPGAKGVTLEPTVLSEGLRPPVSISFTAKSVADSFGNQLLIRGDLSVDNGVAIEAGPRGSVTLSGDTVAVLGSIHAPGGSIKITGAKTFPALNSTPLHARTTVYIGPRSVLSTAGAVVLMPDDFGHRTGEVLPGGAIDVFGNILAEASAVLDVSGASGMLDFTPAELGLNAFLAGAASIASVVPVTSGVTTPIASRTVVPTRVDSNGGSITLTGSEQLFADSHLYGSAGGPTAVGGSLSIASGRFIAPNTIDTPKDVNLVITQSGWRIPGDFLDDGKPPIGSTIRDATGAVVPGRGYFAVDRFTEGGFDSLTLGGVVRFRGPVTIDARQKLSVASGGVLYADAAVDLTAPYVALGTSFLAPLTLLDTARKSAFTQGGLPYFFRPRFGPGSLTVHASLIDVGNLSLQGIGSARLIADGGDIRGDGTLDIAGNLTLRAGQIYPATGVTFTINASDYRLPRNLNDKKPDTASELKFHPGSVTIAASGDRQLPLSAGGELNIYGSRIKQDGTLRAPIGSINIGWDGSGAAPTDLINGHAVAVTHRLTLASGSETSVSAVDPGTGRQLVIPYGILANGTSWIDPAGLDITAGGVPAKDIRLGAEKLVTNPGSVIDIRGGGNLYAYRWVTGQGGTRDILASTTSFAVIPGYAAAFAPYAPFNQTPDASLLGGDPGYVNPGLSVGDRVELGGSSGLAAGAYTLLPARYALLPGAVLITPVSGEPMGTLAMPDGSSLVSGFRFNSLNATRELPTVRTQFEVAPAAVVRSRAQYDDFFANAFLRQSARAVGAKIPRLPIDSGHLVFQAVSAMTLHGTVNALPPDKGIGAYIDISSPGDILITDGAAQSGKK